MWGEFSSPPAAGGGGAFLAHTFYNTFRENRARRGKFNPIFGCASPSSRPLPSGNIPKPSDFDIVICILWSRLGSPLNEKYRRADGSPCESGTR